VIIACPSCSTGYMLPEHLVGPGGARVRCPRCQELFEVDADGIPRIGAPVAPVAPAIPVASVESAPVEAAPAEVASRAVGQIADSAAPARSAAPAPPREAAAEAAPPAPAGPPLELVEEPARPEAPAGDEPLAIARAVLGQLAEREGEAFARARAGHRLFTEFGPALMEAYETCRRRAGADAAPAAFRQALRERWGVELVPLAAREG